LAMVLGAVTSGTRREIEQITGDMAGCFRPSGRPSRPWCRLPSAMATCQPPTAGCLLTQTRTCAKWRREHGAPGIDTAARGTIANVLRRLEKDDLVSVVSGWARLSSDQA
jgi:hypothetical protein